MACIFGRVSNICTERYRLSSEFFWWGSRAGSQCRPAAASGPRRALDRMHRSGSQAILGAMEPKNEKLSRPATHRGAANPTVR